MKNTEKQNYEKELLALEIFSSDSFLTINKRLLCKFGPVLAVYIGNLIDKMKYFAKKGKLEEDGSFFLTYENQSTQTGMSEYQLRKCKNELKKMGILTTEIRGIPPKEFYIIHMNVLVNEYLRNIPLVFKGMSLKKLEECPLKNLRNVPKKTQGINKDTEYKDTEYKDTESNISLSDFKKSDDACSFSSDNNPSSKNNEKIPIKERNKLYLPIAKRLSNIIRQTKQIKHTPQQLKKWANEIRKLVEGNGIPPDRINQALNWYEENAGGEYVPVIESGASLREKFIKLENAMERASKPSSQLPATGSRRYEKGKIDKHKYAKALARRERLRKEGKL